VLPGGHLREITRQMLRWHQREVDEPEDASVEPEVTKRRPDQLPPPPPPSSTGLPSSHKGLLDQ
jgi:hypothetical protein